MSECPVCYEYTVSVFTNTCQHSWCKSCHQRMMDHKHTDCPLCRETIVLPYSPKIKQNFYIEWLLNGGEPMLRWRPKRYRRGRFY